jgi:SAM-dependent methyltransferase
MGATVYDGCRYEYQQCGTCASMFVSPMPTEQTLGRMYGEDYAQFISAEEAHSGDEGTGRVLDELAKLRSGALLDYGCGGGHLLREAAQIAWATYGIDFSRSTTEAIAGSGECVIVGSLDEVPSEVFFDAIHMGDVIEHLTDPNHDMPAILDRLKPGGVLIAQGPLEANFNLFLSGLRLKKAIRDTDSTMPPYHVSLATSDGQRKFFERFGLQQRRFDVFETAHPAPASLAQTDLKSLRSTSLFLLRKISQTLSPILRTAAGNRYFYVGTKV